MMIEYSSTNEDSSSEMAVLQLKKTDVVFCITASGDRTLSLLASQPSRIISLDGNPAQSRLLRLKLAALVSIPTHKTYKAYMADGTLDERAEIHTAYVERMIPPSERKATNLEIMGPAMRDTPMYCGRLERFTRVTARLARLFYGEKWVVDIMGERDIERRQELLSGWPGKTGMCLGRLVVSMARHLPRRWQPFPSMGYTAQGLSPMEFFRRRFTEGLATRPGKESPLTSLLLTSRLSDECLPTHMLEAGHQAARNAMVNGHTMVDIETQEAVAYLKGSNLFFDAFSVSDILSYLDQDECDTLFRLVAARAAPGARFIFRQFLTERSIPEDVRNRYVRDPALEERLAREDSCFIYTFMAGVISWL